MNKHQASSIPIYPEMRGISINSKYILTTYVRLKRHGKYYLVLNNTSIETSILSEDKLAEKKENLVLQHIQEAHRIYHLYRITNHHEDTEKCFLDEDQRSFQDVEMEKLYTT